MTCGGDPSSLSGAGISSDGGSLAVSYSTFSGNRGASGGGLTATGPLTVISSVFSDNQVTNSGGAIIAYGETTVSDSSITGNSATRSGGGIWSYVGATVLVRNSTVANNSTSTIGGGLSNEGGALTIVNSTVANNSSGSIGGGIDNRGSLTVIHSTLSGNSAVDLGSGIRNATNGSSVTLRNTIITGSAAIANCGGPIGDSGYNIDSGTSCGFNQANNSKSSTIALSNGSVAENSPLGTTVWHIQHHRPRRRRHSYLHAGAQLRRQRRLHGRRRYPEDEHRA